MGLEQLFKQRHSLQLKDTGGVVLFHRMIGYQIVLYGVQLIGRGARHAYVHLFENLP